MQNLYFISLTTDNVLRVLQRISSVFSRNRVNIEQLSVFEARTNNLSHFNIVIYAEETLVETLLKQLGKIVELYEINVRSEVNVKAA